ncbi:MAG: hypothetical protein ACPLZB_01140 [Caldisericaceae bacterium]
MKNQSEKDAKVLPLDKRTLSSRRDSERVNSCLTAGDINEVFNTPTKETSYKIKQENSIKNQFCIHKITNFALLTNYSLRIFFFQLYRKRNKLREMKKSYFLKIVDELQQNLASNKRCGFSIVRFSLPQFSSAIKRIELAHNKVSIDNCLNALT